MVDVLIFEKALLEVVDILIKKHRDLGMVASGDWIESLEVIATAESGIIKGNDYTEYLSKGRKPGGRPPIRAIKRWVENKFGYSGKEALSVSFAVANKIQDKGTSWYQKGGSDLIDVLSSKEVLSLLQDKISENIKQNVNQNLLRNLKAVAI